MKIGVHVHAKFDEILKTYTYEVYRWEDMSDLGYMRVHSTEIDFEPLDQGSMILKTIEVLRKAQTRLRTQAEEKVAFIQSQIDDLLCLEDKTEGEAK